MWKAFVELMALGWVEGPFPRMFAVQSTGCAPVVRAVELGRDRCEPWIDPQTVASGLRVPAPLGDRLMLRAIAETGGGALAVEDAVLQAEATRLMLGEGVDCSPEGGAAIAAAAELVRRGVLHEGETVIAFNTGAGWLYRNPADLLRGR
jgi:threonine synthase